MKKESLLEIRGLGEVGAGVREGSGIVVSTNGRIIGVGARLLGAG